MSPKPQRSNSSWGLTAEIARDTQGIVATGFADLPAAEALFLRQVADGGEWLDALDRVAPISNAVKLDPRPERAAALALTCIGLHRLGLKDLSTFAVPFQ